MTLNYLERLALLTSQPITMLKINCSEENPHILLSLEGKTVFKPSVHYDTVTVEHAARFMQCSTRRVRFLLSTGRIYGWKDELRPTAPWKVMWPIIFKSAGKRGPDIKRIPQRMPKSDTGNYKKLFAISAKAV